MTSARDDGARAEEELAEQHEKKEDEVLQREGFEQELMEDDRSEQGGEVDDVE